MIGDVFRKHLSQWPVYSERHRLDTHQTDQLIWIGYRTADQFPADGTTHFDVNIIGSTFFLLFIELERPLRGLGLGSQLYDLLVDIAEELGCSQFEQTPSGCAPNGETRASWLARRGWLVSDDVATKPLPRRLPHG